MKLPGLKINLAKANGDESTGEIDIYGVIGGDWYGEGVTPTQFKKDLAALGDLTRLNVHIHSYGGSVYEGWAIFNALESHPAEVHAYVDGSAMSMASVILMAADHKHIARNGTVMIHNPLSVAWGESKDFRKAADELDKIRDQIVSAYIAGGVTASKEEIISMMDAETYLNAEEALAHGFVDFIGEEKEVEASAANSAGSPMVSFPVMTGSPATTMETHNMSNQGTAPAAPDNTTAEAVAQATAQAHARFGDIMALSRPGIEDFVKNLALDSSVTVADAKMKVADEYHRIQASAFEASRSSRNAPVTEERQTNQSANSLQERWEKNEGGVQSQFLDFAGFEAFTKASNEGLVKMLTK